MKKTIGKISDVCKVFAGQSPKGTSYNENCLGMEFHQGKKAFGDFFLGKSNVWTTEITTTAEPGDILMSVRAPVGPTNITQRKICIGRGLAAIRCREKVIPSFVLYALKNIENKIEGNNGAVFNSINKKMIEKLPIPIIGKDEQQRIVTYLDSTFAKIDAVAKNAEDSLNEAKALFQSALTKMMEPKEGWEEKALKMCSTKIGDGLHGTPKYDENGEYYFINGNNLDDGKIEISNTTKRVNIIEYNKNKVDLNENSVLLSINGTIGKTAFYNDEKIILGKSACYINVIPILKKEYLRYFFLSKRFLEYAKHNVRQATIMNLGLREIREMKLFIPPISTQQTIVATLDSLKSKVDQLQANLSRTLTECAALKQSILRQTFE